MPSGNAKSWSSRTLTCSAKPPQMVSAMAASPTLKRVTPSPTASTSPADSPPGENGGVGLNW